MITTGPQITRIKLCNIQVCVPEHFTDKQICDFANAEHPTGLDSKWTIRQYNNGDPVRNPCSKESNKVHVVLEC